MRNMFKYVLMELQRRKSRTVINIFGYFVAAASMVILLTIVLTAHSAQSAELDSIGTHFIAYIPEGVEAPRDLAPEETCCPQNFNEFVMEHAKTTVAARELPENMGLMFGSIRTQVLPATMGDGYTKTIDAVEMLPSVFDAAPYMRMQVEDGNGNLFTLGGIGPRMDKEAIWYNVASPGNILEGRFLEDYEKGSVMIHEAYSRYSGLTAGDQLLIGEENFNIVGVVKPPLRPGAADVFMNIDDARKVLNYLIGSTVFTDEFNIILVESMGVAHHEQAMADVEEIIFGGGSGYSFGCWAPAGRALDINTNFIWLLIGTIAFGTIVISSKTQYASVIERRRDIGILKMIGWTNKNIVSNIVSESLFQSLVGGIIGCIVAIAVLLIVPFELLQIGQVSISWLVVAGGLLLALLGGIITGIFPALKAAKQNPADILRKF